MNKKRAMIFGTGMIYEIIKCDLFNKYDVAALLDNNDKKWGTTLDGTPIQCPEIARTAELDVIIIASSHIEEIAKQLLELNIPIHKLEIGANYVLDKIIPRDKGLLNYRFDADATLVCDFQKTASDIAAITLFENKHVFIEPKSIPALIGLFDKHNRLPNFFQMCATHHGEQKGIFLDIGANIGTTSLAAIENPNITKCIAFEPSSDNYALLMSNIYINKLHNRIVGVNCAVGDKHETNRLYLSPSCSGDNRLRKDGHITDFSQARVASENAPFEDIDTIVIDDFLGDQLENVKYVWIDVQGYEYFVLSGCQKLLSNPGVSVQIEYWPHGLNETNSLSLLNDFLMENFTSYIDMSECNNPDFAPHDIKEILALSDKLLRNNQNFHTDLFLIR